MVKMNLFCLEWQGFSCILAELSVNCSSEEVCKKLGGNMEKE